MVTQLCIHLLFYRVSAVLAAAAFFAVFAPPYAVEMFHDRLYKMRVISQDSSLEVAAVGTFHAHSGTGSLA